MLIDIHTHKTNSAINVLSFIDGKHSIGLHPWQLVAPFELDHYEHLFRDIKLKAPTELFAIGECGLDRKRAGLAPLSLQEEVLSWHFSWAMDRGLPLIIHCVGAFSELLHLLKEKKYAGKFLLHDFSGNAEIVAELLKYPAYFSFGPRLFRENSRSHKVLQNVPAERLFFETDDQSEKSILDVYAKAAPLLEMTLAQLEAQEEKNLLAFFSDLDHIGSTNIADYLRGGLVTKK